MAFLFILDQILKFCYFKSLTTPWWTISLYYMLFSMLHIQYSYKYICENLGELIFFLLCKKKNIGSLRSGWPMLTQRMMNKEVLSFLILLVGQAHKWYFSVSLSLARVCIQLKTVICSLWKKNLNVWWIHIFTVDLETTLEILMGFLANHENIQTHVLLRCPRVQVYVPSALPA